MSCSASLPIPLPRPVIAAGDCFGALHRFPPRQPLVAADKRFVSGCFAATSITICQMLCGRSAKAGTIRSPNHASDCSGGIEMFDQPIVVAILLLFLCCLERSCRHVLVPKMLTQKANGSLVFRLSDSSNWPY